MVVVLPENASVPMVYTSTLLTSLARTIALELSGETTSCVGVNAATPANEYAFAVVVGAGWQGEGATAAFGSTSTCAICGGTTAITCICWLFGAGTDFPAEP